MSFGDWTYVLGLAGIAAGFAAWNVWGKPDTRVSTWARETVLYEMERKAIAGRAAAEAQAGAGEGEEKE
jgi:hypothetical protein